jgi:hypothetical protein
MTPITKGFDAELGEVEWISPDTPEDEVERINIVAERKIDIAEGKEKPPSKESQYLAMDNRTREAKKLLNEIQDQQNKLIQDKAEFDKQIDEVLESLDE